MLLNSREARIATKPKVNLQKKNETNIPQHRPNKLHVVQ